MTSDQAREFADGLQERVTQMGDRTGEGHYLGQCLSAIRDLASQVDANIEAIAQRDAIIAEGSSVIITMPDMERVEKPRSVERVIDPSAPPRLDE